MSLSAPSKILSHRSALCNMVRRVALEAGAKILPYFDGLEDAQATTKEDGSPVTLADREAEVLIRKALYDIVPEVPMVGEEGVSEGESFDLATHDYFWLVDPLDGTIEFLSGGGDFTVNIALIYKNDPVLGVVYAPHKGELYAGFMDESGNGRALRYMEDTGKEKEISVRRPPREGLTVMSTRHHAQPGSRLEKFLEEFKVEKIIRRASSLKICAVAAGKADLYPRFGATGEWDTAAGDAVLRAAGGVIKGIETREPLRYGMGGNAFKNPAFVALSGDLY
jgi:3'(2'), 5'-bisphosphate nucleotidase